MPSLLSRSPTQNLHARSHGLRRPAILPIPAAVVRRAFGEMGEELLLASTRVRPQRLLDSGFQFRFGTIHEALAHVLGATT
jgi:NAD dependent epimerase/dehydratase family enzyme